MKPRVAIVCDWLVSRGGAERVIVALSEMFPDAPVYTALFEKRLFPELEGREVITSFLQKMPYARKKHYAYLPLMPYAFEQFDLSAYDIVISSSHSCAKGVITKPKTLHLCYCHSPMRYAWEGCHQYFEQFGIPPPLKAPAQRMIHELRMWDRLAADRVDSFIANSEYVRRRIQKYYRRESEVIYPPVAVKRFAVSKNPGKYFLAVGRLTPYKRFDLLVDTFNDLKLPLLIVGTGKEENALRKRAGRFISFLGHIPDTELAQMYRNALALIFPQTEDFGITPLEAMSCGKPVIAYSEGGALETVIPGKTGLFFTEQTVESLKKAVLEFSALKWDASIIREHAEQFDQKIFKERLLSLVQDRWGSWKEEMAI